MESATDQTTETDRRPPTMGLVVLQADETIEDEFRGYLRDRRVVLHHSRIPSAARLTHASLETMAADLAAAVDLFPVGADFDVIGYACTSAAAVIGEGRVAKIIGEVRPGSALSNPTTAAKAALDALGTRRLGLLTPYSADIADELAANFRDAGYGIAAAVSFDEEIEARVARIDPETILKAVVSLTGKAEMDAVFISCTNLRCAEIIAEAERRTGLPVLSSNQVLLWHMLELAGVETSGLAADRLFSVGRG